MLGAGVLLVLIQLALRAWMVYPSWFFHDDMLLLADGAEAEGLSYLVDPHDSQLMPWGRALAWVVQSGGGADWPLAATLTLLGQAAAGLACLWMLGTLFGLRPGVLPPLAAYLFTAMTIPSTMWWAVALNALPLQIGLFCAVAAWVRHLRGGGIGWLLLTVAAVAFALSGYVKALLLIPLLGYLALAYYAEGHLGRRLLVVLRRQWVAVTGAVLLGGGYLLYYLSVAPSLVGEPATRQALPLARAMLGEALPTALVGGPWRWSSFAVPTAVADPPTVLVLLSWLALALFALAVARRRVRTGRAWALLIGAAGASYLLVLTTRAQLLGELPGLEYRYLADVAAVWALVLGLVTLELAGSSQGSLARPSPVRRWSPGPRTVGAVAAGVSISAVASSVAYAHLWHRDNPTEDYFLTAQRELTSAGDTDLADVPVPQAAVLDWGGTRNAQSRLIPLVTDHARFPRTSTRMHILDEDGRVSDPRIAEEGPSSQPGPIPGCGWRVGAEQVVVPMDAGMIPGRWWAELRYLASASGTLQVTAGEETFEMPVRRGLAASFAQVDGGFSEVVLRALDPGLTICLDRMDVGPIEPEESE